MDKTLSIFIFIVGIICGNFVFYLYSSAYQGFWKQVKYGDNLNEILDISDEYRLSGDSKDTCTCEIAQKDTDLSLQDTLNQFLGLTDEDDYNLGGEQGNTGNTQNITDTSQLQDAIESLRYDQQIMPIVEKIGMSQANVRDYNEFVLLFDLSDEYPYKYTHYVSSQTSTELYFFPKGSFGEWGELLQTLSTNHLTTREFTTNQLNNFGDASLYINIVPDDGKVRLLIQKGEILFGLMTSKEYYNSNVKNILENL